MPMPLDQWQRRLEGHFTELASARSTTDFPLFALEHGFNEDELDEIGPLLRARIDGNQWLAGHWLVWVIYAAEFGYDYEGDEYWMSFEKHTPGWREKVSRNQLRTWFSKFQKNYGGVMPSGAWAGQFPIIAWPITHAILPKYLQWQLAKSLYDLRYQLAGLNILSPISVGHLLAENAWDASSRLRQFLQQEELAGRIVLALLGDIAIEGPSPIYLPTLQRIATDLEQVQSSREWLKETRRFVADRLKGAARSHPATAIHESEEAQKPKDRPSLGMRPALMLRPSGNEIWSAVLDIPSFSAVSRLKSDLRAFLAGTRCQITGTGDTWRPAGWLLSHNQKCLLKTWPGAGSALMRFERSNSIIDHLIDSEVRLSTGPIWLCRLGEDGLAREIAGRAVRPGRKYILLSEKPLSPDRLLSTCNIDCSGLHAAFLSVPTVFSVESIRSLETLGLQVARTVRIWPAGLCARQWDGEGYSEWLTTDTPCFALAHDHPLDGYVLRLDYGEETFIKANDGGVPSYVCLPALLKGKHTLSIRARPPANGPTRLLAPLDGVVTLVVREPIAWVPGTSLHAGLTVSVEPYDPSLDVFWNGGVALSILGPPGRNVTCSLSLQAASGTELLNETIGVFELPVVSDSWKGKLATFLEADKRTFAYLDAASGRFSIKGDELGEFSLRLDRDIKPIRWRCRGNQEGMTIRLIDDSGRDDDPLTVSFLSFRDASLVTPVDADRAAAGFDVPGAGGLFSAQTKEFKDSVVVSTPYIEGGFQGLLIEPDLNDLKAEKIPIIQVLGLIRLWSQARLVGPLAPLRHGRIISRLINRLYFRLCGKQWADAEREYMANPTSETALQQLQRSVGMPGFAAVLRRDYTRMGAGTTLDTQWFADVAQRYRVCSEVGLCEFTLQLASRPHHLLELPAPALESLLIDAEKHNTLLRGARLVALLDSVNDAAGVRTSLPRWIW